MRRKIYTILVSLLVVMGASSFISSDASAAEGMILFDDGRTFTCFDDAFKGISDGDDVTMTVSGDTIYAKDTADSKATLTADARVTVLASGSDTVINGLLGVNGNGTLIIGNGSSGKININGGLFADSGTLETNSELDLTSIVEAGAGAIRLGEPGSSATVKGKINGGTVKVGNSITSYQACIKVSGSGTSVDYILGTTISSNGNNIAEGAVEIDNYATVSLIEGCTITDSQEHGIVVGTRTTGGNVGTITDCSIGTCQGGISVQELSTVGDIKKTSINCTDSSSPRFGIDSKGTINSICEGTSIKMSGSYITAIGILGGSVETVDDVNIVLNAGNGAFGLALNDASLGTLSDTTIDAKSPGNLYGIIMQPGRIDRIKDSVIDIEQTSNGTSFIVYQVGPVNEVSGCTMRATGNYPYICGYNVLNDPLHAQAGYDPHLDVMKDNKIYAPAYALAVQQDGKLGALSGNHFYSDYPAFGCIYLSVGGVIEDIKSGTYASKGSGVYINYGSRPGPSGERNSTLKKISYEETDINGETVKKGPVFYGETGWAINANTQGPAPTIDVESEQVEADQPVRGYARYYGGAAKTGGLGNGDAIIGKNTDDRDVSRDKYPVYHGLSEDTRYYMSKTGTDDAVSDDVLKTFVDIDISGKTFHYLTVPVTVKYDPNGGTGDMSAQTYTGEYREDLTAEANGFTRDGFTFTGWNTKADNSGTSYQPEDALDITEAETTLYAQWKENEAPDDPDDKDKDNTEKSTTDKNTTDNDDPGDTDKDDPGKKTGSNSSADTGDEAGLVSMLALLFAAAGVLAEIGYRRRRGRNV